MSIPIATWEQRLATMDHSGGTTDQMRKAAMLAEITALRRALRAAEKRNAKTRECLEGKILEVKTLQREADKAAMLRVNGTRAGPLVKWMQK